MASKKNKQMAPKHRFSDNAKFKRTYISSVCNTSCPSQILGQHLGFVNENTENEIAQSIQNIYFISQTSRLILIVLSNSFFQCLVLHAGREENEDSSWAGR